MPWNAGNPEPSRAAEDHASRAEEPSGRDFRFDADRNGRQCVGE
jgi:hypothetical protein